MNSEFVILVTTAATLGVTHTALGLDHTLPFILLGRARAWSLTKTLGITGMCGSAHIASSVVVGLIGLSLGVALSSLEWFEAARGYWVAWALVAFGGAYAVIALANLRHRRAHRHVHVQADGTVRRRYHGHGQVESSVNESHHALTAGQSTAFSTPLGNGNLVASLFIVFLLGPCEALLPLMTAPSLRGSATASLVVAAVFGGATMATMLGLVTVGWFGLKWSWLTRLEPHLHWISGVAIASSGLAILFLGL
jgi:nickel/cobalt exporter